MNGKRASDVQTGQSGEKENELISEYKTVREELIRALKSVDAAFEFYQSFF